MGNNLVAIILLLSYNHSLQPTYASKNCQSLDKSSNYELSIRNGERRKGRETVDDIEIAKVQWRPNLEKNQVAFEEYDLSKLELNFRKQGAEWEIFKPKKKVTYLGHYTWNVPRIPCVAYEYQIKLPSKNKKENFFCTEVISKLPEDKDVIRDSGFKPFPPINVKVNAISDRVTFQWDKSHCAEVYDVYVADTKQEDEMHKEVLQEENYDKATVVFDNLKPCTNYLLEIYSKVTGGDTRDEYFQMNFHTQPSSNSATFLDLKDTSSTTNTASLSFFTYMDQVNCLNNFTIETCKNDDCFQRELLDGAISHEEREYTSTGLDHCTKYSIRVQPIYQGVDITPRYAVVVTNFDETAEKTNPQFDPEETSAKITMANLECFYSYNLSYLLIGSNETHLEEVQIFNEGTPITINNLQPNSTYEVNMTSFSTHDGQQYTIFGQQKFKTLPKSLKSTTPTPAIETSKINEITKSRSRVPRDYSVNNSGQNVILMQGIFCFTLLLTLH